MVRVREPVARGVRRAETRRRRRGAQVRFALPLFPLPRFRWFSRFSPSSSSRFVFFRGLARGGEESVRRFL